MDTKVLGKSERARDFINAYQKAGDTARENASSLLVAAHRARFDIWFTPKSHMTIGRKNPGATPRQSGAVLGWEFTRDKLHRIGWTTFFEIPGQDRTNSNEIWSVTLDGSHLFIDQTERLRLLLTKLDAIASNGLPELWPDRFKLCEDRDGYWPTIYD